MPAPVLALGLALVTVALAGGRASGHAETLPETVRIEVASAASEVTLGATCAWEVRGPGGEWLASGAAGRELRFQISGDLIAVHDFAPCAAPLAVGPAAGKSGRVTVGGRPFRGTLEVMIGAGGLLSVVNELSLEDYLLGVVPREMPSEWPLEALKAQAVAARSYAACQVRASREAGAPFDLVATTESQVYGGSDAEEAAASAAVTATRGQVLTYEGQLISAVYHSSSGGHTEHSENVWTTYRPYLRGVPDFDQASPKYTWERAISLDEASARLERAGFLVGRVIGIEVASLRGVSGRALSIAFRGTSGTAVLRGEEARRALDLSSSLFELRLTREETADLRETIPYGEYVSVAGASGSPATTATWRVGQAYSRGASGTLSRPSSFTVLYRSAVPGEVVFSGHGWGHGVGLSQWGAYALAMEGWAYDRILAHYYQGVLLEGR
jgi:stage II sporulation protein D